MSEKASYTINFETTEVPCDKQPQPGEPALPTPLSIINEQIHFLDRALSTIDGWSDESNHARGFIVGQIEALKWAMKQFEV